MHALARSALLSVASWALPGGWPALEAVVMAAAIPARGLPPQLRRAGAVLAPPVVARAVAGATLAAAAPDVARTLRMWDAFLPLYARYQKKSGTRGTSMARPASTPCWRAWADTM